MYYCYIQRHIALKREDEEYLVCCSFSSYSVLFSAASADMSTARRYELRVKGCGLQRGKLLRLFETRKLLLVHHCTCHIRERERTSPHTDVGHKCRKILHEKRRSDANGGIFHACAAARASGDAQWCTHLGEI